MAAAFTHAQSSVKKWGGEVEDYIAVHNFFDETKQYVGDFRHRALRHHTLGIEQAIEKFGEGLPLSSGRIIPTRWVAEQHLIEDFGRIPTVQDWLRCIEPQDWMVRGAMPLSKMVA